MTLKLAQFCDDPQKISTKSSYPQKIFIFLKTQKNIEIQNLFEPKKIDRAYVCVKISEYPPWEPTMSWKADFENLVCSPCFTYSEYAWKLTTKVLLDEPLHEISNNVVCATSQASDQPVHTHSLIRAFASSLNIYDC